MFRSWEGEHTDAPARIADTSVVLRESSVTRDTSVVLRAPRAQVYDVMELNTSKLGLEFARNRRNHIPVSLLSY